MKPEEFVEILDRLIAERLKLHHLRTSSTIGSKLDKRALIAELEERIEQLKAALAGGLGS